ncbi:flavin reductase family protein [Nocardia jiangxiensis]|uniref:Flavin reductase family protein n=1 Tax=Nocardia jiangxiensis TaxID=282685 RepID=A0ABW6RYV4_9NOCA
MTTDNDTTIRTDTAVPIDAARYREVLGHFATGVVAITAVDPETGQPAGLAANSFTSVSIDPPLVAFCVAHTSSSWPKVKSAGRYCINVLAEHQEGVSRQFAVSGADKFAGLSWSPSGHGSPILDDAVAWMDARPVDEHIAGDHIIVVSHIDHLELAAADGSPLLFYRGRYGRFTN